LRRVTGPRRLSQAISEGDGISLIVAVDGPEAAQRADADGAEALLVDGDLDAIRAASALPILTFGSAAADARVVRPSQEFELGDGVELVVRVEDEDELEAALEGLDPELFVLCANDEDEPLQHVLDLLSDVPAGKLAIVDLDGITQAEIEALERAGVDAVLVRQQ
jgi:AmiR/NasT family two-component response regulator